MKFKDIKVGDTVFIEREIVLGFSTRKTFFIPIKVSKVTPTQIVTEDGRRYKKDNGLCIGGRYSEYAYNLGDRTMSYGVEYVKDQTQEMKDFQQKLLKERSIQKKIESLKMPLNSKFSKGELDFIERNIDELSKALTNENK